MASPLVAILMGSDSDLATMAECARVLEDYKVPYDIRVLSAHRSPDLLYRYATRPDHHSAPWVETHGYLPQPLRGQYQDSTSL